MLRVSTGVALVLVFVAVVSVQLGGAVAAWVIAQVGPGVTVFLRLAVAALLLWVVVRPRVRGYHRRQWGTVVVFGVFLGCMNWAFYAALVELPLGVAVTVEFLGPLALAAVLSRSVWDVVAVVGALVGVVLVSDVRWADVQDAPWQGLACAAVAGVFWAGYIVASRRVGREFVGLTGLTLAMVVASVVVLPAAVHGVWGFGSVAAWSSVAPSVGVVLGVGVVVAVLSSVVPYSLELVALRRLSAKVFGIFLSFEPVAAACAGWFVLGQVLSLRQVVGMVCVVCAAVIVLGGRQPEQTKLAV